MFMYPENVNIVSIQLTEAVEYAECISAEE